MIIHIYSLSKYDRFILQIKLRSTFVLLEFVLNLFPDALKGLLSNYYR